MGIEAKYVKELSDEIKKRVGNFIKDHPDLDENLKTDVIGTSLIVSLAIFLAQGQIEANEEEGVLSEVCNVLRRKYAAAKME